MTSVLDKLSIYDEQKLDAIEQNAKRVATIGTEQQKSAAKSVLFALDQERRRRSDRASEGILNAGFGSTKRCNSCGVEKPLDIDYFGRVNGGRSWQPHCRECGKRRSKEYRKENKDKLSAYDRSRREREKRPTFSDDQKCDLWQLQAGVCLCCAKPILKSAISQSQIDHKVPLSRGGGHEASNLALAHTRCNTDKHKKTLVEHWQWRYRAGFDAAPLTESKVKIAIKEARRCRND